MQPSKACLTSAQSLSWLDLPDKSRGFIEPKHLPLACPDATAVRKPSCFRKLGAQLRAAPQKTQQRPLPRWDAQLTQ